jgi:predicted TIM-barrel fold metal-dependent hydrolase
MGIDVQVLSYMPAGLLDIPAVEAVPLVVEINDQLAATIQTHPDRFAGFATLPTSDPKAAAELERVVQKLGLKGAVIGGRTNGLFLDEPLFQPILETAAALDVPIYLHPRIRPEQCRMPTILVLSQLSAQDLRLLAEDGT